MDALAYYTINMQHMQQKNREKLTKKYSPVKALRAFGHLLSVKLPAGGRSFCLISFNGDCGPPFRSSKKIADSLLLVISRAALTEIKTGCKIPSLTVARWKKPAERCEITHSGFSCFQKMLHANIISGVFSASG